MNGDNELNIRKLDRHRKLQVESGRLHGNNRALIILQGLTDSDGIEGIGNNSPSLVRNIDDTKNERANVSSQRQANEWISNWTVR